MGQVLPTSPLQFLQRQDLPRKINARNYLLQTIPQRHRKNSQLLLTRLRGRKHSLPTPPAVRMLSLLRMRYFSQSDHPHRRGNGTAPRSQTKNARQSVRSSHPLNPLPADRRPKLPYLCTLCHCSRETCLRYAKSRRFYETRQFSLLSRLWSL